MNLNFISHQRHLVPPTRKYGICIEHKLPCVLFSGSCKTKKFYCPQCYTPADIEAPSYFSKKGVLEEGTVSMMILSIGGNSTAGEALQSAELRTLTIKTQKKSWSSMQLPATLQKRGESPAVVHFDFDGQTKVMLLGGHDGEHFLFTTELLDLRGENGRAGKGPTSWIPAAPMPNKLAKTAAVFLPEQRSVMMIGGFNGVSAMQRCDFYDITSNMWTAQIAMKTPRMSHCAVLYQDKVVVLGGTDSDAPNLRRKDCISFNPSTKKWHSFPEMILPRACFRAVSSGRNIFVVGGSEEDGHAQSLEMFDGTKWMCFLVPLAASQAVSEGHFSIHFLLGQLFIDCGETFYSIDPSSLLGAENEKLGGGGENRRQDSDYSTFSQISEGHCNHFPTIPSSLATPKRSHYASVCVFS